MSKMVHFDDDGTGGSGTVARITRQPRSGTPAPQHMATDTDSEYHRLHKKCKKWMEFADVPDKVQRQLVKNGVPPEDAAQNARDWEQSDEQGKYYMAWTWESGQLARKKGICLEIEVAEDRDEYHTYMRRLVGARTASANHQAVTQRLGAPRAAAVPRRDGGHGGNPAPTGRDNKTITTSTTTSAPLTSTQRDTVAGDATTTSTTNSYTSVDMDTKQLTINNTFSISMLNWAYTSSPGPAGLHPGRLLTWCLSHPILSVVVLLACAWRWFFGPWLVAGGAWSSVVPSLHGLTHEMALWSAHPFAALVPWLAWRPWAASSPRHASTGSTTPPPPPPPLPGRVRPGPLSSSSTAGRGGLGDYNPLTDLASAQAHQGALAFIQHTLGDLAAAPGGASSGLFATTRASVTSTLAALHAAEAQLAAAAQLRTSLSAQLAAAVRRVAASQTALLACYDAVYPSAQGRADLAAVFGGAALSTRHRQAALGRLVASPAAERVSLAAAARLYLTSAQPWMCYVRHGVLVRPGGGVRVVVRGDNKMVAVVGGMGGPGPAAARTEAHEPARLLDEYLAEVVRSAALLAELAGHARAMVRLTEQLDTAVLRYGLGEQDGRNQRPDRGGGGGGSGGGGSALARRARTRSTAHALVVAIRDGAKSLLDWAGTQRALLKQHLGAEKLQDMLKELKRSAEGPGADGKDGDGADVDDGKLMVLLNQILGILQ